jgi:hypothetical protein
MDGSPATWVADLIASFRAGRLSAEELWCVVLDCHGLADPAPVVRLVLRSHAALTGDREAEPLAAVPPAPAPAPVAIEPANEGEVFVLDDSIDELSIPA